MCSSNVSDPANRLRKTRKKKILCRSPFRSGHMSAICARLTDKGKVGVLKREKPKGPLPLLPAAAPPPPPHTPPRAPPVQRKTLRPVRTNPPAAVRVPRSICAEKRRRPDRGVLLTQLVCPGHPVQEKKSRPDGSHLPGQAVKFPLDIPQSPATILLRKRSN